MMGVMRVDSDDLAVLFEDPASSIDFERVDDVHLRLSRYYEHRRLVFRPTSGVARYGLWAVDYQLGHSGHDSLPWDKTNLVYAFPVTPKPRTVIDYVGSGE